MQIFYIYYLDTFSTKILEAAAEHTPLNPIPKNKCLQLHEFINNLIQTISNITDPRLAPRADLQEHPRQTPRICWRTEI